MSVVTGKPVPLPSVFSSGLLERLKEKAAVAAPAAGLTLEGFIGLWPSLAVGEMPLLSRFKTWKFPTCDGLEISGRLETRRL